MNRIIMTICLSVWIFLTGFGFAAESRVPEQVDVSQILMTDESEFVELSLNPEDELLRLLEEEANRKAQEAKKTKSQKAAPQTPAGPAQSVKPEPEISVVEPVSDEVAVVADPNGAENATQAPVSTPKPVSSDEEDDFRDLRKKLMFDQMESVEEMSPEEQADGLAELIAQLRSLETPKKITPEKKEPEQVETAAVSEAAAPTGNSIIVETAQSAPDTKENLLNRIENAENVREPLCLADVLYRQRYYQPALKYYQQAFETLAADDAANRQWVMFQMGNCARQIDEIKAIEIYGKLIAAYPNSKWTHIAMSRRSILQWSQDNKIQKLIAGDVQ